MEDEEGGHGGLVVVAGQAGGSWRASESVSARGNWIRGRGRTDVEVGEDDLADAVNGLRGVVSVVVPDWSLERGLVPGKVVACAEEMVEARYERVL